MSCNVEHFSNNLMSAIDISNILLYVVTLLMIPPCRLEELGFKFKVGKGNGKSKKKQLSKATP